MEWDQAAAVRAAVQKLACEMLAASDVSRADRLWPADAIIFQTNPLNLAYGACGTAIFLHRALGELPSEIVQWFAAQPVDAGKYPPGLYSGLAGIAWTYAELGWIDRALEIMDEIQRSPLRYAAPDMFEGVAGWGLTALRFLALTGDERFRHLACDAADRLVSVAERSAEQQAFWRHPSDGSIRLGFGYGGSGIALFLLVAWWATGITTYLDLARSAMEFELSHAQARGRALAWGVSPEDAGSRPYWLRGGAGVVATLSRLAQLLGDTETVEIARRAAIPCMGFFSAAPHGFEGLAAMGEAALDMYAATGENEYLDAARVKAAQTLLFSIERPNGIAFPGRFLFRISHDLGTGGAGIGLFLLRTITPGPRLFHDLDLGALKHT